MDKALILQLSSTASGCAAASTGSSLAPPVWVRPGWPALWRTRPTARLSRLLESSRRRALRQADGSYAKTDLLILGDWGLAPFSAATC